MGKKAVLCMTLLIWKCINSCYPITCVWGDLTTVSTTERPEPMNAATERSIAEAAAKHRQEECLKCPLGRASGPDRCPFRRTDRKRGEVLIRQGQVPDAVHYLKSGSVLVTSLGAQGAETSCSIRNQGALLGLELLGEKPCTYEAVTLNNATVCSVCTSAFMAWIGDLDTRTGTVLRLALGEMEQRQHERVSITGRTLPRLARYLLDNHANNASKPQKLSNKVLARTLGMRAETLSRALSELRRQGILAEGRSLQILNLEQLAQIAEQEPALSTPSVESTEVRN